MVVDYLRRKRVAVSLREVPVLGEIPGFSEQRDLSGLPPSRQKNQKTGGGTDRRRDNYLLQYETSVSVRGFKLFKPLRASRTHRLHFGYG